MSSCKHFYDLTPVLVTYEDTLSKRGALYFQLFLFQVFLSSCLIFSLKFGDGGVWWYLNHPKLDQNPPKILGIVQGKRAKNYRQRHPILLTLIILLFFFFEKKKKKKKKTIEHLSPMWSKVVRCSRGKGQRFLSPILTPKGSWRIHETQHF